MKALVYYRSVVRYLLAKGLNRFWPRTFFARVAPLRLQEIEFSPPGPDWVVLRPRLCGICGSDLRLLKGAESFLLEPYASLPAVLGHEVVGEVVEAPPGSEWRAGDRVVVEPILPCAVRGVPPCRYCAAGAYNLCENFLEGDLAPGVILGFTRGVGGGMAEMMAAHPSRLVRVPDHLPDEVAVLTDSLASALQPVLDNFPADRDTVIIYGAGIIGQHLLRLLRALGSKARVVMVARYRFQEELALEGGADVIMSSPSRALLGEAVGARLVPTTLGGGNLEGGADLFFDCVGSQSSLQEGLLTLGAGGPTSWWAPPAPWGRWTSPACGSGNSSLPAPPCTPTASVRARRSAPMKRPWNCWPGGIIPAGDWFPTSSLWPITARPSRRPLTSAAIKASRWFWT